MNCASERASTLGIHCSFKECLAIRTGKSTRTFDRHSAGKRNLTGAFLGCIIWFD